MLLSSNSTRSARSEYRQLMFREILIWLVAVPLPILALIVVFVF